MTITEKLSKIKDKIEKAKIDEAKEEGQISNLFSQLEEKAKCQTTEEAKKILDELNDELDEKEEELETGIKELEEAYEW